MNFVHTDTVPCGEYNGFALHAEVEDLSHSWEVVLEIRGHENGQEDARCTLVRRCSKFDGGAVNLGLETVAEGWRLIDTIRQVPDA